MADLNKLMNEVSNMGPKVEASMKELLAKYEELYREAHRALMVERNASKSLQGLEDFYLVVGSIRRNKDIVGSLLRGMRNLKGMKNFQFVEEDIPMKISKKEKPQPTQEVELEIDEDQMEDLQIPHELVEEHDG